MAPSYYYYNVVLALYFYAVTCLSNSLVINTPYYTPYNKHKEVEVSKKSSIALSFSITTSTTSHSGLNFFRLQTFHSSLTTISLHPSISLAGCSFITNVIISLTTSAFPSVDVMSDAIVGCVRM